MTEGEDNVDLTDPFALERPPKSDGGRPRVDIDLTDESALFAPGSAELPVDAESEYSAPAYDGAIVYPETPQVQVRGRGTYRALPPRGAAVPR